MKRILILLLLFASPLLTASGNQFHNPYQNTQRHWVFFKNKGTYSNSSSIKLSAVNALFTQRALNRRLKRGVEARFNDLPVSQEYVSRIMRTGAVIWRKSRWLNAVSVIASDMQLSRIEQLDFVARVEPVKTFFKSPLRPETAGKLSRFVPDSLYGPSYHQLNQAGINRLHDLGFIGEGVFISVFDTGFFLDHEVFDSLISDGRLIAAYDFINGDEDVQDGIDAQRSHGTSTFSVIAGNSPGNLIGGAYGADFALAKTELYFDEIRAEEDNWIAAAEWADSLGVDIISSSVGYNGWYDYSDMDGNTALITIAADIAASKGILVVNSAGNEGDNPWRYIIAPADGDSVMAVGGVDSTGNRMRMSSIGPTYDGRIKPDVMAMGSRVYGAAWQDIDYYNYTSGTSMSAPLAASAAALVWQANPNITVIDLMDKLKGASSNADSPNNEYGWGIVNAFKASGSFAVTASKYDAPVGGDEIEISLNITGPEGPVSGAQPYLHVQPDSSLEIVNDFVERTSGFYDASLLTTEKAGGQFIKIEDSVSTVIDSIYILVRPLNVDYSEYFDLYPNPFQEFVNISFYLPQSGTAEIYIYSVAGEKVRDIQIPTSRTHAGVNTHQWYADNNSGTKVAGGVYIIRLVTPFYRITNKAAYTGK
ncbi:MAG: S8 family serine peptidase [candidate division Zixibacteria bacterium]|nr:S8 family serine peptidase [candidate division Zixibacteria bacterium]